MKKHCLYPIAEIVFLLLCITTSHAAIAIKLSTPIENAVKPTGLLYSVHQGRDAVWIGGENGLYEVRGGLVTHHSSWNSPIHSDIWDITEDKDGNVWLATQGSGVIYYNVNKKEFVSLSKQYDKFSVHCWRFKTFAESKLLVTCRNTILEIDTQSKRISDIKNTFPILSRFDSGFYDVSFGEDLWFGNSVAGLYRVKASGDQLLEYTKGNGKLEGGFAKSILVDSRGDVWVATEDGVSKYDKESDAFSVVSDLKADRIGAVERIFEDGNGGLWFIGEKVTKAENSTYVDLTTALPPNSHPSSFFNDITEGVGGEMLLVSTLDGVTYLPNLLKSLRYLRFSDGELVGNISSSLNITGSETLIATNGSLFAFDFEKSTSEFLHEIGYVNAMSMLDVNHVVMSVSGEGLFKFNLATKVLTHAFEQVKAAFDFSIDDIYAIERLSDGSLILGVSGELNPGLYRVHRDGQLATVIEGIQVDDITLDAQGNLVVASREQIIVLNPISEAILSQTAFASRTIVNCVKNDDKGNVFICTNGQGLKMLDSNYQLVEIEPQRYGNARYIRELLVDKLGYLWVMTNKGVFRISVEDDLLDFVDSEVGIFDQDFEITASVALENGTLFIAGDKANYLLDPFEFNGYLKKRRDKSSHVRVFDIGVYNDDELNDLTSLFHQDNTRAHDGVLRLTHNEYMFKVAFSTGGILFDEQLKYEYRLFGLSELWNLADAQNSFAIYSTLPSGEYEFQVRVVDVKSQAAQPITSLKVVVLPPPWLTTEAKVAYVLLAISLLYLLYKVKTQRLNRINAELERSVHERTKQLAESREKVSSLLKSKEALFANISHEIRTPLSLIIGTLVHLRNSQPSPKTADQLVTALNNARRLDGLVEQILELSRLDAKLVRPIRRYDPEKVLAELVESFRHLAEVRSQKILLLNNFRGCLLLSEGCLESIVYNLISNALKHNCDKACVIVNSFAKGEQYRLEVSDDGSGIPSKDLDKVFERYIRVEEGFSAQGFGLGLSLVKELVTANKGEIQLVNNEAGGSKFIVTFPIQEVQHLDSIREAASLAPLFEMIVREESIVSYSSNLERVNQGTILVVEDNQEMADFLVQVLEEKYKVHRASDGVEALKLAEEEVPDLIVTDLMMPNIDGATLARKFREQELTSHIPIILLTALADDANRLNAWRVGVDDFIAKPFDPNELVLRVTSLIANRQLVKQKYLTHQENDNDAVETMLSQPTSVSLKDQRFLEKFGQVIADNFHLYDFGRKVAAQKLALSERQLNRKLGAICDYNFSQYLRNFRLLKAKQYMVEGRQITEVSYDVGFSSPSYFSACFKSEFGMTPKDFLATEKANDAQIKRAQERD